MKKLFLLVALMGSALVADDPSGFVVHEWGTFTSMQGSDGLVLEGLYHEEQELPPFVYRRSTQKYAHAMIRQKMETPVIYFYAPKEMTARVRVDFPQGVMTQWYPHVFEFGPDLAQEGQTPTATGGFLDWQSISVVPDRGQKVALPVTSPEDPWNFARETDSALVRLPWGHKGEEEWEKYLFYRGLGTFQMPVDVQEDGGFLVIRNRGDKPIGRVFVLSVRDGRASFTVVPRIEAGEATARFETPTGTQSVEENAKELGAALERALVERGLYPKEARSMVRTWNKSWFHTPGVRVLYVLPREWTDGLLPITVEPKPDEMVRVLVGRIEVLTREHEARVEEWIRLLGSDDPKLRDEGSRGLASLGRFAEPNLRRTIARTKDAEVRARCEALLADLLPAR